MDEAKMLSEGTYGKVYSCHRMVTKEYHTNSDAYKRELYILRKLGKHENICTMIGHGKTKDKKKFILLEHIDASVADMKSGLLRMRDEEKVQVCRFLVQGVACGLAYLHSKNIIHADVKSDNIMVRRGPNDFLTPVIIDFSNSGLMKRDGTLKEDDFFVGGAFCLASPEMLAFMHRYYTRIGNVRRSELMEAAVEPVRGNTDVYSLGCMIYSLLTGLYTSRFHRTCDSSSIEACYVEASVTRGWREKKLYKCLPNHIRESLEWMMHPDPGNRATVRQLIERGVFVSPPSETEIANGSTHLEASSSP